MDKLNEINFDNTFARLPDDFFRRVKPTPYDAEHYLISFNQDVACLLDLAQHNTGGECPEKLIAALSGRTILPGSDPLAMLYAGHQFGHYVPQLGDGRAILLGEIRNSQGEKWDLQLKGSGLTPFSRDGDGRAVLRSSIREYLCSEAMHGLGIPTTRALSIIGTDAEVYREQIETGAILTRIARSHVRFGSFEVFYYRDQHPQIHTLADYVIELYYPGLRDSKTKYSDFLLEVVKRTAKLIAHWQAVGFSHGVMNTDNMSILGDTIDYGPFGFMETYNPDFICNHSDHQGRYAFAQQPNIGLWNLTCLAQALTPLMSIDAAKYCLQQYEETFILQYQTLMAGKLGFKEAGQQSAELLEKLLALMHANHIDYTRLFRNLGNFSTTGGSNNAIRDMFIEREAFDNWAQAYKAALLEEKSEDNARRTEMNRHNPKYILRNYMAQIAIEKASLKDFSETDKLLRLLRDPYTEHIDMQHYAEEPPDWAGSIEVSCSS